MVTTASSPVEITFAEAPLVVLEPVAAADAAALAAEAAAVAGGAAALAEAEAAATALERSAGQMRGALVLRSIEPSSLTTSGFCAMNVRA